MRQIDCKKVFKDYSRIILGTFIAGCGIAVFSNPAKLTGGGTTGVGTIIYYTFGIDPGVTMLCINIPLFFLGMHFFGSMYGLKVFVGAVMLSVWTSVIGNLTGYRGVLDYTDSTNVLISAVCYGVLVGSGIGIVMRAGKVTFDGDINDAIEFYEKFLEEVRKNNVNKKVLG